MDFIKHKLHVLLRDKTFSEILTGSAWAMSARIVATGVVLVSNAWIARVYGAEVIGVLAVLNSFLLLVTIFTVLGTATSILRLIPEQLVKYSPSSAFQVYRKAQNMVIGTSVVTGVLFFLGSEVIAEKIFSKPHLSFYFALAALFVVFKSLMLLNTQAVRGLKMIKIFALMEPLLQCSNLTILISLSFFSSSKDIPVYAFLVSIAVTGMSGWVIMEYAFKKRIAPADRVQPMGAVEILSISLPMFLTAAMTFVIGQTGVIMLGIYRSETEVGYYDIAVKLATLTSFLLSAINSMAAPKFSELYHSGKVDELFRVAKKSTKLIFFISSPILLGLIIFGNQILRMFFQHRVVYAYHALILLSVGQFVNSICGSTALFMNMTGHQRILRNIMFITALINITLSYNLIPTLGIRGAAASAMFVTCLWNILTLIYINKKFGKIMAYYPVCWPSKPLKSVKKFCSNIHLSRRQIM